MQLLSLVPVGMAVLGTSLAFGLIRRWAASTARVRFSRPKELMDAELVHSEKLFGIRQPIALVARVDRVYQTATGQLVLVELKSRRTNFPYLSDVIQLSVQRVAVSGRSTLPVASHGYVLVRSPALLGRLGLHRVELMSGPQVFDLAARREAILDGRVRPNWPVNKNLCPTCSFRHLCRDQPSRERW